MPHRVRLPNMNWTVYPSLEWGEVLGGCPGMCIPSKRWEIYIYIVFIIKGVINKHEIKYCYINISSTVI